MIQLLLAPPVALLIYVALVSVLAGLGRWLAGPSHASALKSSVYASGELAATGRAGLLFVDFATGDLLYLTGTAEVIWDGPEVEAFAGAERLMRFKPAEGRLVPGALPLRWSRPVYAPQLAETGDWPV